MYHWHFGGWRIGGLTLLSSRWQEKGRIVTLASYHPPGHMCWLWFVEAFATSRIIPRVTRLPGHQSKTYIDLPFVTILFVWQDEGRYRDPADQRVRTMLGMSARGPDLKD